MKTTKKIKKYQLFLIACCSGFLLSLGWPEKGFAPLLLIAFVPLLWVEDYIATDKEKRFGRFAGFFYSYIPFLIWNILTTYWVWNSTPVAVLAFTLNALFMAFAFQLFHYTHKKLYKGIAGYFLLPIFWIAFEYAHLNWDGSWPWLTLGNGFASMPALVQWYQFTGVFGGALWIFVCNVFALKLFKAIRSNEKKLIIRQSVSLSLIILVPIGISLIMYFSYAEPDSAKPVEVVVVQPNVDPYNEQFNLPPSEITKQLLILAYQKTTNNTEFIITPESALQGTIYEDEFDESINLHLIKRFVEIHPQISFIAGLSTRRTLPTGVETPAMREDKRRPGTFYEYCNAAMLIDSTEDFQLLHKSKLTPGVECMPLQKQLPFIKKLALDFGGTVGSLGTDNERKVFQSKTTETKVGTVICYESVYGEYVGKYVRNGAELIFVITNDGWWKDTPGYRQHFQYARLRAIENRKWIARSANTGTSGIISPRGDIIQKTNYWEKDVLNETLLANNKITFYAQYGDYLGRVALVSSGFLFLLAIVYSRVRKKDQASQEQ